MGENVKTKTIDNSNLKTKSSIKNITQFFTFELFNETYGIEVTHVREVIEYEKIFPIPRVSSHISGVINLRGDIVPVVNLSQRLFNKNYSISTNSAIVIIELQYKNKLILTGILIDKINAVIDIENKNISHIPDFGAKIKPEYIKNIGKAENCFYIILNHDNILNIEELAHLDK